MLTLSCAKFFACAGLKVAMNNFRVCNTESNDGALNKNFKFSKYGFRLLPSFLGFEFTFGNKRHCHPLPLCAKPSCYNNWTLNNTVINETKLSLRHLPGTCKVNIWYAWIFLPADSSFTFAIVFVRIISAVIVTIATQIFSNAGKPCGNSMTWQKKTVWMKLIECLYTKTLSSRPKVCSSHKTQSFWNPIWHI